MTPTADTELVSSPQNTVDDEAIILDQLDFAPPCEVKDCKEPAAWAWANKCCERSGYACQDHYEKWLERIVRRNIQFPFSPWMCTQCKAIASSAEDLITWAPIRGDR